MANRKDFYYLQIVTEAEIDAGFADPEAADWALAQDTGLSLDESARDIRGGIVHGFTPTQVGGPSVVTRFTAGTSYDGNGKRVRTTASLDLDLSRDGQTQAGQAGTANGNFTAPTDGFHRWLAVHLVHDRVLSDPRIDGFGVTVYHKRDESFHFSVTAGAEVPQANTPVKTSREAGKVLLCDVRIKNTGGVVDIGQIDTTRMEWWINSVGGGDAAKALVDGSARVAIEGLLDYYSRHVSNVGAADKHPSQNLTFSTAKTWADGQPRAAGAAINVKAALEGILDDLAAIATPSGDGADCIGSNVMGGVLTIPPPNQGTPAAALAGTVTGHLAALFDGVNGRVFRGGDNGIAGALSPATAGTALGSASKGWDSYIKTLQAVEAIACALIPDVAGSRDLGSSSKPWQRLIAQALSASGTDISVERNLSPNPTDLNLGTDTLRWNAYLNALNYISHPVRTVSYEIRDTLHVADLMEQAAPANWSWVAYLDAAYGNCLQRATLPLAVTSLMSRALQLPHGATFSRVQLDFRSGNANNADYVVKLIARLKGVDPAVTPPTVIHSFQPTLAAGWNLVTSNVVAPPAVDNETTYYHVVVLCAIGVAAATDQLHRISVTANATQLRLD